MNIPKLASLGCFFLIMGIVPACQDADSGLTMQASRGAKRQVAFVPTLYNARLLANPNDILDKLSELEHANPDNPYKIPVKDLYLHQNGVHTERVKDVCRRLFRSGECCILDIPADKLFFKYLLSHRVVGPNVNAALGKVMLRAIRESHEATPIPTWIENGITASAIPRYVNPINRTIKNVGTGNFIYPHLSPEEIFNLREVINPFVVNPDILGGHSATNPTDNGGSRDAHSILAESLFNLPVGSTSESTVLLGDVLFNARELLSLDFAVNEMIARLPAACEQPDKYHDCALYLNAFAYEKRTMYFSQTYDIFATTYQMIQPTETDEWERDTLKNESVESISISAKEVKKCNLATNKIVEFPNSSEIVRKKVIANNKTNIEMMIEPSSLDTAIYYNTQAKIFYLSPLVGAKTRVTLGHEGCVNVDTRACFEP